MLFILRLGQTEARGAQQTPEVTQQPDEFKIETRSLVLRLVAPLSVLPGWFIRMKGDGERKRSVEQQQGWVSPVDTH